MQYLATAEVQDGRLTLRFAAPEIHRRRVNQYRILLVLVNDGGLGHRVLAPGFKQNPTDLQDGREVQEEMVCPVKDREVSGTQVLPFSIPGAAPRIDRLLAPDLARGHVGERLLRLDDGQRAGEARGVEFLVEVHACLQLKRAY